MLRWDSGRKARIVGGGEKYGHASPTVIQVGRPTVSRELSVPPTKSSKPPTHNHTHPSVTTATANVALS